MLTLGRLVDLHNMSGDCCVLATVVLPTVTCDGKSDNSIKLTVISNQLVTSLDLLISCVCIRLSVCLCPYALT